MLADQLPFWQSKEKQLLDTLRVMILLAQCDDTSNRAGPLFVAVSRFALCLGFFDAYKTSVRSTQPEARLQLCHAHTWHPAQVRVWTCAR